MKITVLNQKDFSKGACAYALDYRVALWVEIKADSLKLHFVFDHAGKILWLYDINN